MGRGVLYFLLGVGSLFIFQVIFFWIALSRLSYKNIPFQRSNPAAQLKILFIGDSTARGTGSASNTESVAGWFGQDFPQAHIVNEGVDGRQLDDLIELFQTSRYSHFNLIIVQAGANDILRFTDYKKVEKELSVVIDRAKKVADHVVILHSGNVGLAPVFIWPLNNIMTERARKFRSLYIKKAKETGVHYVDLFSERGNDLFLKDIKKYYSPDLLHPSGQGYRWWYQRIRETLQQADIKLED